MNEAGTQPWNATDEDWGENVETSTDYEEKNPWEICATTGEYHQPEMISKPNPFTGRDEVGLACTVCGKWLN